VQGEEAQMGKAVGKDQAKGKATYPGLFGVEASRKKAEELIRGALADLASFKESAEPLRAIARFVMQRTN